ncbi:MAG: substrate-binding domain-containing protein [Asticcacaulis sp.]|nr:substrate-binding domain-containing protein [Asticcacaulis sp.]
MKLRLITALAASMLALTATAADAASRIYVTLSRSDKFIDQIKDALLAEDAKDSDVDMKLEIANNDRATQLGQIDAAIKAKYDAIIVLTVDNEAGQYAYAQATKAGIPIVFVNTRPAVEDIRGKVAIVACNDIVAGRLQMRLLSNAMNNQGNLVIIRGQDGHSATTDRSTGIKEILAGRPGIKVVAEDTAAWHRDKAEELVNGWLDRGIHIDAIAANSDEMALGAMEALRKHGIAPGKVFIGGVDGTTNGLNGIRAGELQVTMLQNTTAMAQMSLADAKTMAQGGYAQQFEWVPYEIVIPSNVDKYMRQTQ